MERISMPFGREELTFEWGRMAKQANGAVVAQVGGTVVLSAVVAGGIREGLDFFPLQIEYREKFYASGRIPGSFFRREGRPGDVETLRSRVIDRPLRPLFPEGYRNDTQVYANVISSDNVNPPDVVALNACSLALLLSDIPFSHPVAGVRIGRVDGQYIVNPSVEEIDKGEIDLVVAGTEEAINMVEAGAKEVSEADMLEALRLAHAEIQRICRTLRELMEKHGRPKFEYQAVTIDPALRERVEALALEGIQGGGPIGDKKEREKVLRAARDAVVEQLLPEFPEGAADIMVVFEEVYQREMRRLILETGQRADGRRTDEIRQITVEVGVLPRAHGSALFTRGQTQALGTTTLGTNEDQLLIDDLLGVRDKAFYLHYNFPSFSVGEARPLRGPGRREIGHGALAERSLIGVIPDHNTFPYTIRIVSDILESNGSSSMASVCAGCLSLMDCGVPIKAPVSGIAMGLVKEGEKFAVLSDIIGLEDHLGDMDFKVAGTRDGITALQMDIKILGVTFDILEKALEQARQGRLFILDKMLEVIPDSRPELSRYAPRITMLQIPIDRIRDVIGPGGKMIREIIERTKTKIDVEDDGRIFIAAFTPEGAEEATKIIRNLTASAEIGQIYSGKVVRIADFGAFVEILPGKDGLVHISELDFHRVGKVEDICREGDILLVKVIDIDPTGRVRLSRKQAMQDTGQGGGGTGHPGEGSEEGGEEGERRGGDRPHRPHRPHRPRDEEHGRRGGGGGGGGRR